MTATLSSTFFGPVQWYQKLLRYDRVFIEQCDSYQKQTYRNRCLIATTGGVQALTVPVSVERREESGECRVDSVECRVDSVEFATALPSSGTGNPVGNSTLSTLHSKLSNGNPVGNSTLYTLHSIFWIIYYVKIISHLVILIVIKSRH